MQLLKVFLVLLLTVSCPLIEAQKAIQPLSWQQITRASGYIFSGTVTAIEHVSAGSANGVATMRVTFQVEQAIRGVQSGQTLVVREWVGLWDSPSRFRTGERLLLFLYPPSRLGLTSPVGGSLGRFEIDANGNVLVDRGQLDPLSAGLSPHFPSNTPGQMQARASVREFAQAIQRMAEDKR